MKRALRVLLAIPTLLIVSAVNADESMPPWTDAGDVPVPAWTRSVTPNKPESAIYAEPGKLEARRGSAQPGARLPLYGTRRAAGCQGRWLNVGPLAWMCSDVAEFTGDEPISPPLGVRPWTVQNASAISEDAIRPPRPGTRGLPPLAAISPADDGLPYRYFFAGKDGAYGFANLASALDDSPDQDLEPGFAVAIMEEQTAHGERWGKSKKGRWIAMRELGPARPLIFHGDLVENGKLDMAWVVVEHANVYASEKIDKAIAKRVRFERLKIEDEKPGKDGGVVKIEGGWMRARDISRPKPAAPPPEIQVAEGERWIDVDLVQQALVAYEGDKPVFATIVSTGKGPPGSDFETKKGTHRIWVKIFTTKMDNLDPPKGDKAEKEDPDRHHYSMEDVPWVQFFDKAIALHGAFWHRDFGHVHSHGCVNLAPIDARWLFAFTGPHLPSGWTAVLPTKIEQGTLVRVR